MAEEEKERKEKIASLEYKLSIVQQINNLIAFSGNVERVVGILSKLASITGISLNPCSL